MRQAIASRASMPRHNRRGSRIGRGRSPHSTPFPSTSSRPKRRSTRRSSARRYARSRATCSTGPTKRRSTATPSSGPTSRRARASPPRPRIVRISRGCAMCRATSTNRSPTCAPAWRVATRCRACRCSDAIGRSSRTSKATPAIRYTRRSRRCRQASRRPIRTRSAPKPPPSFATSSLPPTRGC